MSSETGIGTTTGGGAFIPRAADRRKARAGDGATGPGHASEAGRTTNPGPATTPARAADPGSAADPLTDAPAPPEPAAPGRPSAAALLTEPEELTDASSPQSAPPPNPTPTPALNPNPKRPFSPRATVALLSLRSRVALLVMVAVGLTVALVSVISYVTISHQITTNLDNNLFSTARTFAKTTLATPNTDQDFPPGMRSGSSTITLNLAGLQGALVDAQGATYLPPGYQMETGGPYVYAAAPTNLTTDVEIAQHTLASAVRTVDENGTAYRVVTVPVPQHKENSYFLGGAPTLSPPYALVIATSMSGTEWTLHLLSLVFTLFGFFGIVIAGFAGFAVARAALRPVQRLTVATEYIAKTGDLRRIQVTGKDELARLTGSFNTMLEALARSQDHQRRLVADAGHELRTPLTSMRTNLDLLAQAIAQAEQEPDRPRLSAQDRAELMTDVRAQMEELSLLISDLVELSRDEHPSHAIEQVDLAEVVQRAVERVQRRAPDLHYDLRLEPWYLDGDPAALERAVTNLLDNAAKFSPPAGTVTVRLAGGALEVSDQGPGIAEADLAHVFERFYRSPEARTMPGSGLGLAIVRQVAENHGGRVAAARAPGSGGRPGGALLGVWLPGGPRPPQ